MASHPRSTPHGLATRDRIIALLRRGTRSVEDLAAALGMTDNAIRPHLASLEKAGLAEPAGVVRDGSVGKPARLYQLTPAADHLASAAYEPVLVSLVAELSERLDTEALEVTMRSVGRRLATTVPAASGTLEDRVRAAGAVLAGLGGDADIEAIPDGFRIQGYACPLSTAVAKCSQVCGAATELSAGITGAQVVERCDHGERPRCRFDVTPRRDDDQHTH